MKIDMLRKKNKHKVCPLFSHAANKFNQTFYLCPLLRYGWLLSFYLGYFALCNLFLTEHYYFVAIGTICLGLGYFGFMDICV